VLWRWRRQHRCVGRGVWKYIDIDVDWDDDRPVDRKSKGGNKSSARAQTRSIMNGILGQQLWKGTLVASVLTIVLGVMVLAWPGPTILIASTMFGIYLLLSGFAELFLAFTLPRSAATRLMLFLTGALSLVLAILSFRHFGQDYAVLLLSVWLGTGFILLGVSESAVALSERDLPGRGWYAVLGIMSMIVGGIVLAWPFDSIIMLTLASGASLVILGLVQVVQAFQIRSDTKAARQTSDALYDWLAA
jgi:uncharacterized membrane protein HdeD (DUF308 family)